MNWASPQSGPGLTTPSVNATSFRPLSPARVDPLSQRMQQMSLSPPYPRPSVPQQQYREEPPLSYPQQDSFSFHSRLDPYSYQEQQHQPAQPAFSYHESYSSNGTSSSSSYAQEYLPPVHENYPEQARHSPNHYNYLQKIRMSALAKEFVPHDQ